MCIRDRPLGARSFPYPKPFPRLRSGAARLYYSKRRAQPCGGNVSGMPALREWPFHHREVAPLADRDESLRKVERSRTMEELRLAVVRLVRARPRPYATEPAIA